LGGSSVARSVLHINQQSALATSEKSFTLKGQAVFTKNHQAQLMLKAFMAIK
jgi:hypothetical protein